MKEGESEVGGLRRTTPSQQASVCVSTNTEKVAHQLSAATAPSPNVQNLGPASQGPDIGHYSTLFHFPFLAITLLSFNYVQHILF